MRRLRTIPTLWALATVVTLSVPDVTPAQLATSLPSPSAAGDFLGGGLSSVGDAPNEQAAPDSVLRVTLSQALRLAANVDPNYVAALRQVGDADWVRRQAWMAFVIPSAQFQWSFNRFSSPQFNLGTGDLADELTTASLGARYDLFTGGARIYDMQGSAAGVDGARAGELQARFQTALGTEADYYQVIAQTELLRVAQERTARAVQQLDIARARVLSGAAVQTDSLQLLFELTRAQVEELQQGAAVKVSRLQLGRRIGHAGPADAVPLDTLPARELPITEADAYQEALTSSPRVEVAQHPPAGGRGGAGGHGKGGRSQYCGGLPGIRRRARQCGTGGTGRRRGTREPESPTRTVPGGGHHDSRPAGCAGEPFRSGSRSRPITLHHAARAGRCRGDPGPPIVR